MATTRRRRTASTLPPLTASAGRRARLCQPGIRLAGLRPGGAHSRRSRRATGASAGRRRVWRHGHRVTWTAPGARAVGYPADAGRRGAARGRARLPRLRAVGARHAGRVLRRTTARGSRWSASSRATSRTAAASRSSARRPPAAGGPGRGRRPARRPVYVTNARQAFPLHRARQAPHPPDAGAGAHHRLPAVAGRGSCAPSRPRSSSCSARTAAKSVAGQPVRVTQQRGRGARAGDAGRPAAAGADGLHRRRSSAGRPSERDEARGAFVATCASSRASSPADRSARHGVAAGRPAAAPPIRSSRRRTARVVGLDSSAPRSGRARLRRRLLRRLDERLLSSSSFARRRRLLAEGLGWTAAVVRLPSPRCPARCRHPAHRRPARPAGHRVAQQRLRAEIPRRRPRSRRPRWRSAATAGAAARWPPRPHQVAGLLGMDGPAGTATVGLPRRARPPPGRRRRRGGVGTDEALTPSLGMRLTSTSWCRAAGCGPLQRARVERAGDRRDDRAERGTGDGASPPRGTTRRRRTSRTPPRTRPPARR
jgi:hypothetical protein